MNLNPLIKADGYYALSQFLNIDNLREESFAFLRVWSEKYILRRDIDLPALKPPLPPNLSLFSALLQSAYSVGSSRCRPVIR